MKGSTKIVIGALVMALEGCAGKVAYLPPDQPAAITNSIVLDQPRAEVWNNMVPALGRSFFVINNLEKESGFINLSYSGDPEKYVDCGVIDSYVKNARGERTYRFPAAAAHKTYETFENGTAWQGVDRTMTLDGRLNVVLEEMETSKTKLTVTAKYVLTKKVAITTVDARIHHQQDSISFSTNGKAVFESDTICRPTGALEKEVFNTISQSPSL